MLLVLQATPQTSLSTVFNSEDSPAFVQNLDFSFTFIPIRV